LPTATLFWQYGWLRTPSLPQYFRRARMTGRNRLYVKIVCPTLDYSFDDEDTILNRDWYGVLDITGDQWGGVLERTEGDEAIPIPTGEQTFTCYGLEKVLADHVIDRAFFEWTNPDTSAIEVTEQPYAPPFNEGGLANRSLDTVATGGPGGTDSHVFTATPSTAASYWSTSDIVKYLLHRAAPRDRFGQVKLPFYDTIAVNLPTWDRPTIEQAGQTVYSLLGRLLDRRRLWSWFFEVIDNDLPELGVYLNVNTLTEADIALAIPTADPIPENPRKIELRYDYDQGTTVALSSSGIEKVDEVIVRGPRRVSVFSVSIADTNLEKGWDETGVPKTLTDEYNEAASNAADYADLGTTERQKRNAEARAQPRLADVFTLYQLPADWGFTTGNGLGDWLTHDERYAVFPHDTETRDNDDRPEVVAAHIRSTYLESTLPLYVGVDYSGAILGSGLVNLAAAGDEPKRMRPFLVLRVPETKDKPEAQQRWAKADELAKAADIETTDSKHRDSHKWSCRVEVPHESRQVRLNVTGAPRHILDNETSFVPIEHETLRVDKKLAEWDLNTHGIVTLAIRDPRYVESRWPVVDHSRDYVRAKIINAGKGYDLTYVVPSTVVGVDPDTGALVRSNGGFFPPALGTDDVKTRLESIARIAARWYTETREVISLESVQLRARNNGAEAIADFKELLDLGVMVEVVGFDYTTTAPYDDNRKTVNTVITSIGFTYPLNGVPKMTLQTWAGELDAMQLWPEPVGDI